MKFIGPAVRLADGDITRAAQVLECQPACIRAVIEVESAGGGFLKDGRPKILFEAHIFSRLTNGRWDGLKIPVGDVMVVVSWPKWERSLYKGGVAEYARLEEAMRLDEAAALKAASWGMFQVLGENHQRCGFQTVQEFAAAMVEGEGRHLDVFAAFVKGNARMWDALINQDWSAFARLYNGPGYATNRYDERLAAAFDKLTQEA